MPALWRFLLVVAALAQPDGYEDDSCVAIQVIKGGDDQTYAQPGDRVTLHYTGTLTNGRKFDSSRDRGKPFITQIGMNQVIPGMDEGVLSMTLGERALLHISAHCGYGAQGAPPAIPPNADLIFDVELLGINGKTLPPTTAPPSARVPPAPQPTATSRAPQTPVTQGPQSTGTSQNQVRTLQTPASQGPAPQTVGAQAQSKSPPSPSSVPVATSSQGSQQGLPSCTWDSCGHAISWDPSGVSQPLCLCNPLCVTMKDTPGILPCCPGLQRVCLDPYRSPSPHPPAPTPQPPAQRATLPSCRTHSCGKAMSSGPTSTVPVCACDNSCLSSTSSLPCCPQFKEVCQNPVPGSATAQQSGVLAALQAQVGLTQATQPKTAVAAAPTQSAPVPGKGKGKGTQSQATPATAAAPPAQTAGNGCQIGATKWDEQPDCDKKRWAIKQSKCKKVCPATNSQLGVQYWDRTDEGKSACEAAVDACHYTS